MAVVLELGPPRQGFEAVVGRFLAKIQPDTSGCLIWTGSRNQKGYGRFNRLQAHRFAYEAFVGPIPDGLTIDHLCRVRNCVLPAHLEPVTQAENVRRGIRTYYTNGQANKTHCPQGHSYSGGNLYLRPSGRHRECRACRAARRAIRVARGGSR